MTLLSPRLKTLLGVDHFEDIAEGHLLSLFGASEFDELDIKRQNYPSGSNTSLGSDVASFANSRGGLLVLGMGELDDQPDVIATHCPFRVDATDVNALKFRILNSVAPYLPVEVRCVKSDRAGLGYLLVYVPPGLNQPYCCTTGNGKLISYPVRVGAGTRFMTEPEIAAAYRARLAGAEERSRRLTVVHEQIWTGLPDGHWLAISAVPELPGQLEIKADSRTELKRWLQALAPKSVLGNAGSVGAASVGHALRCITLNNPQTNNLDNKRVIARIHSDGSVSIARRLHVRNDGSSEVFHLVSEIADMLWWIGAATNRVGSGGGVDLAVEFQTIDFNLGQAEFLVTDNQGFHDPLQEAYVVRNIRRHDHTLRVSDLTPPTERAFFQSLWSVARDLLTGFGAAEPPGLTAEGVLSLPPQSCALASFIASLQQSDLSN